MSAGSAPLQLDEPLDNESTDRLAARGSVRGSRPADPLPALAALVVYTLGVGVLARGLLSRLNTSIIGPLDGDNFAYVWSIWHFKQAVLGGRDPNYTNQLRALDSSVPVFNDGFFNHLLSVPLQFVLTPLGAYDVTILLSFVLGGLCAYLLASAFTRSWVACLVAGLVFTFSTYHFGRATMHLGLLSVQFLPLCAWRLVLFIRDPGIKSALLAGIAAGLVTWADVYYGPYFLLPFGVFLLVALLLTNRMWFLDRGNLLCGVLVLGVAAVVALPSVFDLLLASPAVRAAVAAEATTPSKIGLSADLVDFFLPDPYNAALGDFVRPYFQNGPSPFPARSVFLGVPAIVFAIVCICLRRGRTRVAAAWLGVALITMALALGPRLYVAGHDLGRFPVYSLAFRLPPLYNFRAPAVLGVVTMLAASVLAALGVAALLATLARGGRSRALLGAAVLGFTLVGLLPSTVSAYRIASFEVPTPNLYRQIAASPDNGLLLDVPTYIASSMYMGTVHGKRLVGGILPREPADSLTAVDQVPYLWWLDSWRPVPDSDEPIPGDHPYDVFPLPSFVEGLRENGISWVVLHRNLCVYPALNAAYYCPELPHYDSIHRFLFNTLGRPFADDGSAQVTAWHVADAPPSLTPDPAFRLGTGWAFGIDSGQQGGIQRRAGPTAQLYMDTPRAEAVHLRIRASAYARPMRMKVLLNGRAVGTADFQTERASDLDLGMVTTRPGRNVIQLRSPQGCMQEGVDARRCWSFNVERVIATS